MGMVLAIFALVNLTNMRRIRILLIWAVSVLPLTMAGQSLYGEASERHSTDSIGTLSDSILLFEVLPEYEFECDSMHQDRPIPDILPPSIFIPVYSPSGSPWNYAPLPRPAYFIPQTGGFMGGSGFGRYYVEHYDRFFSQMLMHDVTDIPQLMAGRQIMLGNTLRLGKKIYFLSGILYGGEWGILENNWGLGARNGFLFRVSDDTHILIWSQHFHPMAVYLPIYGPQAGPGGVAIMTPAIPEIFSIGAQASFQAGEFIIGIGASYYYYK